MNAKQFAAFVTGWCVSTITDKMVAGQSVVFVLFLTIASALNWYIVTRDRPR